MEAYCGIMQLIDRNVSISLFKPTRIWHLLRLGVKDTKISELFGFGSGKPIRAWRHRWRIERIVDNCAYNDCPRRWYDASDGRSDGSIHWKLSGAQQTAAQSWHISANRRYGLLQNPHSFGLRLDTRRPPFHCISIGTQKLLFLEIIC